MSTPPMIGPGQRRASARRYGYAGTEPVWCICRGAPEGTSTRRGAEHHGLVVVEGGEQRLKRCRHSTLVASTRPVERQRRAPKADPRLARLARQTHHLGSR